MCSLSEGRDWVRRGRGNWFGFFGLWAEMGSFGKIMLASVTPAGGNASGLASPQF
jgi:hypothetical protein